ncbi:MAG: SIR2 family NAD-dependent protein deacylase [Aggregatilineales bacterium]
MDNELIQKAADILTEAEHIAVLTGAGVSKESGIPTFRDAMEGLWAQYDPQELATPQAFKANPKLVWDWYEWRRTLVADKAPNPGHIALADLQKRKKAVNIITQNVDDLHEQAGSIEVIHLHGNIATHKCFDNCQGTPTIVDINTLKYGEDDIPTCPHCGAYMRPNVVWFGEILPQKELQLAGELAHDCDVMIVVGTSGLVHPAASLPKIAKGQGTPATIIEVNPDYSMITRIADIKLEAPSGVALPKVLEAMGNA